MSEQTYVNVNALINELSNAPYEDTYYDCVKTIEGALSDIGGTDIVEVLRCKNCKYFYQRDYDDSRWGIRDGICCNDHWSEDNSPQVYFNDYCSFGERSDE